MPCYDGREEEDRAEARRRLDDATRAACESIRTLISVGTQPPAFAIQWYEEHKRRDEERARHKVEEKARQERAELERVDRYKFEAKQRREREEWDRNR